MWRQQHVVGHHCFTNVDGRDPDIKVDDPDIKKFSPTQRPRVVAAAGRGAMQGYIGPFKGLVYQATSGFLKGCVRVYRVLQTAR